MTNLHTWLASGSFHLWPFLLNHLWQSSLFVLVLWPVALWLKRAPARLRYTLLLVASAKFLLPAALVFVALSAWGPDLNRWFPPSTLLSFDVRPWLHGLFGEPRSLQAGLPHTEIYCLFTLVWLVGVAVIASLWFWRQRELVRVLAGAARVTSGREAGILRRVEDRLGARRPVELALLSGDVEPGVFRVLRPVLLLPAQMPGALSDAELEAIFLHELVHVRRRDNLIASLHRGLCCLLWFHPLVWLLDRRLLSAREEACDEGVLALGGRAEVYARGLLKTVQFGLGWRLAGVSSAGASNLKRRLERILSGATPRPSVANHLGLVAALLLLAAFSLIASPSGWSPVPGPGSVALAAASPAQAPFPEAPRPSTVAAPPQELRVELASAREGKAVCTKGKRAAPAPRSPLTDGERMAQQKDLSQRSRRLNVPAVERPVRTTDPVSSPAVAVPGMQP